MTSSYAVEFDAVSKTYSDGLVRRRHLPAIRDVSLQIRQGEVFGLLGPNRAGKTTLVKVLLSLCKADVGRVVRLGKPGADRSTLARIGYVHESPAFPRYLTATEVLHYYGALSLVPFDDLGSKVAALLELVGLADRGDEPIARFSKGMVQRLGLAQALVNDPELLVLDEPTEGLDLAGRRLLRKVAADRKATGRSVLLVTHVVAEVEQLCDRIGVLVGGRLAFVGTPAQLRNGRNLEDALLALYERPRS